MPIDFTGVGRPPLSNTLETQNLNTDRTLTESPVAQKATGGSSTADTISITDTANQLKTLETQITQAPVVDTQRTDETKRLIEANQFDINPERIADKLLSFERQLAG